MKIGGRVNAGAGRNAVKLPRWAGFSMMITSVLGLGFLLLWGRPTEATPAYARRFDLACQTCHSPLPPRLNNTGMLFHRFGFRLPDADEKGNLTMKLAPSHGILDAASLVANLRARHDSEAEVGSSKSTLELGEIELVAGTSVGEHLSAQIMFLPRSDKGAPELEDMEVQANLGAPRRQFSVRGGLAQTNLWQKANHGSLTLSAPLIYDEEPLAPVGDFAGFSLGKKQIELEGGLTLTNLKEGSLTSTLLSVAILNGVQQSGERADRNTSDGLDVYLQAMELFGSQNTVGGFYYNGRTTVDPAATLQPPGPFKDRYSRYGVLGNFSPSERLDLAASFVQGTDKSGQLGVNIPMRGLYAEATATFLEHWIGVLRLEEIDPNRDQSGDLMHAQVVSTTCQVEENIFLTAEYRRLSLQQQSTHQVVGSVRFTY